jgi:predicted type IV restriction endonuclease
MLPATLESFRRDLEVLVRKFDADAETYQSAGYPEAQVRNHFINPFLKALGWDVDNEAGVPYHLCEVWVETGETTGRPDYTLRLAGQTKFFIEAKAPSVGIDDETHILQAKRYA